MPSASKSSASAKGVVKHAKKRQSAASKSAASTSRALGDLDLDPNAVTPNPAKITKRPTPALLRNKIIVKSGRMTLSEKKLRDLFASYDDAEFRTHLPAINNDNRKRIILVAEEGRKTDKVTTAQAQGLLVINDKAFMKMSGI